VRALSDRVPSGYDRVDLQFNNAATGAPARELLPMTAAELAMRADREGDRA
jgi:hypothetical protein